MALLWLTMWNSTRARGDDGTVTNTVDLTGPAWDHACRQLTQAAGNVGDVRFTGTSTVPVPVPAPDGSPAAHTVAVDVDMDHWDRVHGVLAALAAQLGRDHLWVTGGRTTTIAGAWRQQLPGRDPRPPGPPVTVTVGDHDRAVLHALAEDSPLPAETRRRLLAALRARPG